MRLKYDVTRADTVLYRDISGLFKLGAANFPQSTNDIDSIGFYFKALWFPKILTNNFRNSESSVSVGTNNITFKANDWSKFDINGVAIFPDDNATSHFFYDTAALTNGAAYTVAAIVKPNNGIAPTFLGGDNYMFRFFAAGNVAGTSFIDDLGDGYFFCQTQIVAGASGTTSGIQKTTIHNAVGFEISAIMIVNGTHRLFWMDYLRTTGAVATRQLADMRKTDMPLLNDLQGFIDVEYNSKGARQEVWMYGASNSSFIDIGFDTTTKISLRFRVATVFIYQTLSAETFANGRYRISYYITPTVQKIWVDGVIVIDQEDTYAPQGSIKSVGNTIEGAGSEFTDSGVIREALTFGKTEDQTIKMSSFKSYFSFMYLKRATIENNADVTAAIIQLQSQSL